jgi:putative peptidoglycan lipid II flippase
VPEKPAHVQQLTVHLTQLMMVTPVIFSISGLLMGILHAHQRFLLPSLAISMNNVGLIIGALVFTRLLPPDPGIAQSGQANVYGLALGAILSAVLHLAVQLPGLRSLFAAQDNTDRQSPVRLRFLADWRLPGVLEVLALMGPRVLGLAVVQINFWVNIVFTSGMVAGSLTALTTAWTLMFFVLGVIAQSVGTAVFPSLSALAAQNDMEGFKGRLAAALRSVLFLSFPATIGLILLGEPVVRLLFERGKWTAESTAATTWALAFFAVGVAGFSALEVLSRAFYALSDTATPVKVGIAAMLSNILLSFVLIRVMGDPTSLARGPFAGLALANALTTLLEAAALWALLRRRIGGLRDAYVLGGAWRAGLAALGMGVALLVVLNLVTFDSSALLIALVGGSIGAGVFFGLSLLLGIEEARTIPLLVLRRVRR